MTLRPVDREDTAEWLRMRMALWPDSEADEQAGEIAQFLSELPRSQLPALHAAFVYERSNGALCGMVEVSVRSYADGCSTAPVGYLEAWYVDPDRRGQDIGRALLAAAEQWAREQGCREMASDADLENISSQAAHKHLGYREIGRVVQFVKALDPLSIARQS